MSGKSQIEQMHVFGILPNLVLREPFECEWVALLPGSDERMQAIAKKDKTVHRLLNGFHDQDGGKCEVTALVVQKDAPAGVDFTALMSFRNLFAMSCVLKGWQSSLGQLNVFYPLYSDYFDFYPFRPVGDGVHIQHRGAALNSWNSAKEFRAQRSADLPSFGHCLRADPDEVLCDYLVSAWKEQFIGGEGKWESLFRSLAVAYHAAGLPKKNLMWHYDFGVSIALWISAFETLCHNGGSKDVGSSDLLELLASTRFSKKALRAGFEIKVKKEPRSVNAVQYLCWKLYGARNRFLHGNPFPEESLFLETRNGSVGLNQAPPLVYKAALLNKFQHFLKSEEQEGEVAIVMSRLFEKRAFSEAISFLVEGKRD
ncbi:MAG TPA: hypothetical protein VGH19_23940 [Verrucomicrobiae bacterium]